MNENCDISSFGVVLQEIITWQLTILQPTEVIHIVQWVRFGRKIEEMVGGRMQGDYNVNDMWKVVDLVLKCTEHDTAQQRPHRLIWLPNCNTASSWVKITPVAMLTITST